MLKVFATALTIGGGGNGGNFAPSLFAGSDLGFVLSKLIHLLGISDSLPIANFTIVGMAGILSGLFHAPLTAIFLIGEITGGYDLMVPLMIVSSISFAVSKRFETHSMDVTNLAYKGEVFTSNKDKNIIQSIDFLKLVDTDVLTLKDTKTLEEIIDFLSTSHQTIFPVLDDTNKVKGIVDFEQIRPIIFNSYRVKFTEIKDVITQPKEVVNYDDGMELILKKFEKSHEKTLVVIRSNKFYGLISKENILESYREKLKEMVID